MIVLLLCLLATVAATGYLAVGFRLARPIFHRAFDAWYDDHRRRWLSLDPLDYKNEGLAVARSRAIFWMLLWPLLWFKRPTFRLTWGEPMRLREQRIQQLEREAGIR